MKRIGLILVLSAALATPACAQCLNQGLIDWGGASAGNNPSVANVAASIWGAAATVSVSGPTEMAYSANAYIPLKGWVNLCSGGFRNGATGLGLQATVPRTAQVILISPVNVTGTSASASQWFWFDLATNLVNYFDMFTISDNSHASFVNCSLFGSGLAGLKMRMELVGGNNNAINVLLTTNTLYKVTCVYRVAPATNSVAIYDVNLNLLGEVDVQSTYSALPGVLWLGVSSSDYAGATAHVFYGATQWDFARAPFPLLEGSIPCVENSTNSITTGLLTITR